MTRFLVALSLALGLMIATRTVVAEDKTHDGKVVSVAEGKLMMSDKEGKGEHSHTIDASTKVTLDGKAAKITDLKKGDSVKVTVGEGGKVSAVAAMRSAAK